MPLIWWVLIPLFDRDSLLRDTFRLLKHLEPNEEITSFTENPLNTSANPISTSLKGISNFSGSIIGLSAGTTSQYE